MKPVRFMGGAKLNLSAFPDSARLRAGHELFMVQVGREPDNWKPMPSVGAGVSEIRVRDQAGQFRVIYVANFRTAIYMLHEYQKKTQKTSEVEMDLAGNRDTDAQGFKT